MDVKKVEIDDEEKKDETEHEEEPGPATNNASLSTFSTISTMSTFSEFSTVSTLNMQPNLAMKNLDLPYDFHEENPSILGI